MLNKKVEDGEIKYLIKWEGWSKEESTWEPMSNLGHIQDLIAEFEKKRKPTNANKLRGRQSKKLAEQETDSKVKVEKKILHDLGMNIPEEIINVKKHSDDNILCLVKFKDRPDGITTDDAYVSSTILKEIYPKVLIDFYESKIKFVDKK